MDGINIVKFPGLDLEFKIDRVAFRPFGLFPVYWYGIIISVGFLLAIFLALRNCKKFGLKPDDVLDLVLWAAPSAIIGARLFYIVFNWHEFNGDIMKMINIRTGGLAIYGGIVSGVLAGYIFTRVKKINFLAVADLAGPYFIMAQGIGRWGNFVNQEAFGRNTDLPWGMHSNAVEDYLERLGDNSINPMAPVHPTFLYESLWDLGVFFFLLWYRKRYKVRGELFFLYMIMYGIGRAWVEGLRTDSLYIGSTTIRVSQFLGIVFALVFTTVVLIRRKRHFGNTPVYNTNIEASDEVNDEVDGRAGDEVNDEVDGRASDEVNDKVNGRASDEAKVNSDVDLDAGLNAKDK